MMRLSFSRKRQPTNCRDVAPTLPSTATTRKNTVFIGVLGDNQAVSSRLLRRIDRKDAVGDYGNEIQPPRHPAGPPGGMGTSTAAEGTRTYTLPARSAKSDC
jgi:hypothetical protein